MSAAFILLIIAIVLWFMAAIPFPYANPVQLGWMGMFFYGLSMIVGK